MRRRASRVAIFAAVVAAHLLTLQFLVDFRPSPDQPSDLETSVAITLRPMQPQRPQRPRRPQHALPAGQRARARISQSRTPATSSRRSTRGSGEHEQEAASHAVPQVTPRAVQPWIDWEKQGDAAVAARAEHAAEAARRASALSRWREHVMPAPWAPHGPQFRWDYAATHRVVVTPGSGIVINISDRCFVIVTGLFVLPVCRIGKIPAYGDLFAHMDDPKDPDDSNVP